MNYADVRWMDQCFWSDMLHLSLHTAIRSLPCFLLFKALNIVVPNFVQVKKEAAGVTAICTKQQYEHEK